MKSKVQEALEYYLVKRKEIFDFVNSPSKLTVEEIIESGKEMAIIEYKITALQVAKEN